jgi:hypothetical protein
MMAKSQILEEIRMTLNTDGIDINDVRDNLQQLVQRGETGDASAVMALGC